MNELPEMPSWIDDWVNTSPIMEKLKSPEFISQMKEANKKLNGTLASWSLPPMTTLEEVRELARVTGRDPGSMTAKELYEWAIEFKREATIRLEVDRMKQASDTEPADVARLERLSLQQLPKENVSTETQASNGTIETSASVDAHAPDHWVSLHEIHSTFRDRNKRKPSKSSLRRWINAERLPKNPNGSIAEYWLPDVQALLAKRHIYNNQ